MPMPMSRRLWTLVEPVHAVTYFAPRTRAAMEAAGYRGFWRGYFAGRAAPLGSVGAAPVIALFYGFAPAMVERALPSVWDLAPPQVALGARRAGATAALTDVFAAQAAPADHARLAGITDLLRRAVHAADLGGRPLGAANAALPWPEDPVAALWHGASVLRELRGDGHVAALLTAGITGLEALVLRAGSDLDRDVLQPARGWTDQEWDTATEGLRSRGLIDSDGRLAARGRSLLDDVETVTDRLAAQPWQALGPDAAIDLVELLTPLSKAAVTLLPARTPIGVPIATDGAPRPAHAPRLRFGVVEGGQ